VASRREHGRVTETHRQALEQWLGSQANLAGITVGPLLDVRRDGE